jgi:hypothetical protein
MQRKKEYHALLKTFNPMRFDPTQRAKAAREASNRSPGREKARRKKTVRQFFIIGGNASPHAPLQKERHGARPGSDPIHRRWAISIPLRASSCDLRSGVYRHRERKHARKKVQTNPSLFNVNIFSSVFSCSVRSGVWVAEHLTICQAPSGATCAVSTRHPDRSHPPNWPQTVEFCTRCRGSADSSRQKS